MRTTSWACRRMKLSRSVLLGQVFFFGFLVFVLHSGGIPDLHSELTPSKNNEDPRVGSLLQFFSRVRIQR